MSSSIPRTQISSNLVGYRLRQDIRWQKSNGGKDSAVWIASDSLTRRVFRCGDHEYQLLNWLNDTSTVEELQQRFHQCFAPKTIEPAQIQQLIHQCSRSGLMRSTASLQSKIATTNEYSSLLNGMSNSPPNSLESRAKTDRMPNRVLGSLRQIASTVLRWTQAQVSLGSPDRALAYLGPRLGAFYSGAAVCFWTTTALVACVLIAFRWDAFWAELPGFDAMRSPASLVGYGVVFVLTRFFHELGHAIVCKRAGAACRDVGIIMSFGMVCPYVDITDSARIGNRWVRMSVAAAGIYTEIILSGLAGLVWYSTHPGWLHHFSLQTMLVCSVTTILFNANPLMKYDGYYVLCDWLNTQNLRDRAFLAMDGLIEGKRSRETLGMSLILTFYFLASSMNRVVITLGITTMVYLMAAQWNATGIGIGFVFVYLLCNMILSLAAWANTKSTGNADRSRRTRAVWLGWTAAAVAIAWGVNIPLPNRVHSWGEFRPGTRLPIYATTSGRIESVPEGILQDQVAADDVLLQLRNDSIAESVTDLLSAQMRIDHQLRVLERMAYYDPKAMVSIPLLQSQKGILEKQWNQKKEELGQLAVSSTCEGKFEPALARPADSPESPTEQAFRPRSRTRVTSPVTWTDVQSVGRFIERGTLVGWIVKDKRARVECHLSEEQFVGIVVGTQVRVRLEQSPHQLWAGTVSEIAKISQTEKGQAELPLLKNAVNPVSYQLLIDLERSADLQDYLNGNAEIVLIRPEASLLNIAMDQWFRNVRIR